MSSFPLTQTFTHTTSTHTYSIRWSSLGSPSSPPLVFIHGTPWSSRVWVSYAASLARHFHVYLFDNPGFGESPLGEPLGGKESAVITDKVALDADLARQSEAFAALFKAWESDWAGRKAHVVAHDHGGLMALRAHLLHGCGYASLCLVDVVAVGPFGKPLFKLVAENEGVFKSLTPPVFEGVVEGYIRDAADRPLSREDMETLKAPWIASQEGRNGFIRQMVQANSRSTDEVEGRYAEVGRNMPVRVIWGEEDKWIPVKEAQRVAEKVGAKEVVVIEGAGHLIMYDQREQFGVELAWWLSEVSRM